MQVTVEQLMPIATFIAGCLVALVLHEAAHITVARILGVRVKRVGVDWRGPFIVRESGDSRANACIALAGPIANIITATLCWTVAPTFAHMNMLLGLSNLLPMQGSDGYRAWMVLRELKAARAVATTVPTPELPVSRFF
jgi:Zn-dependent protease